MTEKQKQLLLKDLCAKKQGDKYSIWVGGGEVNDYYLSKDEAEKLAYKYRKEGYDDVVIEKQGEQNFSRRKTMKFKKVW